MDLLPNEQVVTEIYNGVFKVTTHRLRYDWRSSGSGGIKSIMLEELALCEMIKKSQPLLLVIAALAIVGGIVAVTQNSPPAAGVAFAIAVLCVVGYYMLREQFLAFASAGVTIFLAAKGWPIEDARKLFGDIEAAKNARFLNRARS